MRVDVSELDCIYLTYDEPNADLFHAKIAAHIPWVKRIHGVEGSDAAHKAAAAASNTDHFILIDGDNLPDWEFFNQEIELRPDTVYRWRARNVINGLCYGNGGLSCWPKSFVENMRTHENTDGSDDTVVEFCYDTNYWAMHDVWSTTHPNQSPYHAWRAGFREGVKLCLDRGKRVDPADFEKDTWHGNRLNLEIWCSIGADVTNGKHAMNGARYGAWKVMFDDDWDYTEVRDFKKLQAIYEDWNNLDDNSFGEMLERRLGLHIVDFSVMQSRWFKSFQRPYENIDIMLRESDYRRVLRDAAKQI